MANEEILKWVGVGLSVAGAIISLASGLVSDKKLDIKIAQEVAKQIEKK